MRKRFVIGLFLMAALSLGAQTMVSDSLRGAYVSSSSPISRTATPSDSPTDPLEVGSQYNVELAGDYSHHPAIQTDLYSSLPYSCGGFSLSFGGGMQMNKFLYFGAAIDITGDWGKTTIRDNDALEMPVRLSSWVIPVYADARVYWPNQSVCTPFWEVQMGGYLGIITRVVTDYSELAADKQLAFYVPKNGFYFSTGLGVRLAAFTMGVGYKLYHQPGYDGNYAYFKVGVSIFKPVNLYRDKR